MIETQVSNKKEEFLCWWRLHRDKSKSQVNNIRSRGTVSKPRNKVKDKEITCSLKQVYNKRTKSNQQQETREQRVTRWNSNSKT